MKNPQKSEDNLETQVFKSLMNEVPNKNISNDLKSEQRFYMEENNDIIRNANNMVLVKRLAPEISDNEKMKRIHKCILLVLLTLFLIVQFISVYSLSEKVINYSISEKAVYNISKLLLTFISGYITSVVIELIAILKYIVKNVFDTSIAELLKIFKEDSISESQKTTL